MDTNVDGMIEGIPVKERYDLAVEVDNQRMQLISPPPEEILSLQWGSGSRIRTNSTPSALKSTTTTQAGVVSKRKRAPPTPVKLSGDDRQDSERIQNPSVRRILFSTRRSRRSATPIPPYEPPPDIFTPPREVFMSPAPTKSAPKRKGSVGRRTRARAKGKEFRVNTNVPVKQEIPDDIDLLAPMPPPSPTDDPLLLSGPPELEPVLELQGVETSLMPGQEGRDVDVEPVRFFDTGGSDGGWSDNDSDTASKAMALVSEGEEEGEEEEVRTLSTEPENDEFEEPQNRELLGPIKGGTNFQGEEGDPLSPLEDSQDDESSDTTDELDLVKITSADPRAAARAVAILKQHDYDCYTKLAKKHRASQSAVVDFAKECRRKDVSTAGIVKTADRRRRRSTMGVVGDKVIIPGSPITTLPNLLQQVEEEITHLAHSSVRSAGTPIWKQASRDPFQTPTSVKSINIRGCITIPKRYLAGPREWTKEDWKLLDACFTDQRINPGDSHDILGAVDAVALEDVVARFIDTMGGQSLVNTFGETWSRDNLLERTKALLKKQHSGNVAPPTTPVSSFSIASPLNFTVPDFTPTYERRQRLPPTLLAPRYSHLLEEAATINDIGSSSNHLEDNVMVSEGKQVSDIPFARSPDFTEDLSPQRLDYAPPTNNLGRFRGFFSSYLPILSKSSKKTSVQEQPCLPLAPPSVLQKSRGPVETPPRPLVPRAPHPKDLVHLNHISLKPSKIPRTKPIPRRLVELVPIPQTTNKPETTTSRDGVVPRPRRSSGSSVRDLVKGFEQMDKSTDRRLGSIGGTRTLKQGQVDVRPVWKP